MRQADIDRFWSHVNKSGPVPAHRPELGPCWLWEVSCTPNGYGKFSVGWRELGAHRVAYELANGKIRSGTIQVMHACDNKPCVNPAHLSAGTDQDNADDMKAKGRQRRLFGASNGHARFTEDEVRSIRAAVAGGESESSVAERLNTGQSTISRIVSGKRWGHIK